MRHLELRFEERLWDDAIDFLLMHKREDGTRSIGRPVVIEQIPDGSYIDAPTFRLSRQQTQELLNELWRQGFRPADGTGNSGHLAAVQYHLEDMRKLVFVTEGHPTRETKE